MYLFSVLKVRSGKAWGLYASLDEAREALPGVLEEGDGYQIDRLDTERIGVATLVEHGTYHLAVGKDRDERLAG